MTKIETRSLGSATVGALGLGCMAMSGVYGPADDDESVRTMHAALDAGVTLLDTGDFYANGHNELLVGRFLKEVPRDQVQVSVKFGALRGPDNSWGGTDTRPQAMKNFLAYSLTRLGVDYVDVYRPARLDPAVPIEETVGAIAEMVEKGFVRQVGLSEVGPETIRRAASVTKISDLQIEYSLLTRDIEAEVLPLTKQLGIGITAYGVLSRGLISEQRVDANAGFRGFSPRFQGENLEQNLALVEQLKRIAAEKGATVGQLAFAWVLAQGEHIVPLIGTRKAARIAEAVGALEISLTDDDLAELDAAAPLGAAAGTRYPEAQMAMLEV